jgi:selenide, water dikinase
MKLLESCSLGGCASKMPAESLRPLLAALSGVGHLSVDDLMSDSAVVRFGLSSALFTVDFGTPVSNNAFEWGEIAAQNAFSDVYASGGTPSFALSILGWPSAGTVEGTPEQVLLGAASVASAENVLIVGGHSLSLPTPIFGLAVIGEIDSSGNLSIGQARSDQVVAITKPLGTGLAIAARKSGLLADELWQEAVDSMRLSNGPASRGAVLAGILAATDVSGFGLATHLLNVARSSKVGIQIDLDRVPRLAAAAAALDVGVFANLAEDGALNPESEVSFEDASMADRILMNDPQTSGGLLLFAPEGVLSKLGKTIPLTVIGRTFGVEPAVLFR